MPGSGQTWLAPVLPSQPQARRGLQAPEGSSPQPSQSAPDPISVVSPHRSPPLPRRCFGDRGGLGDGGAPHGEHRDGGPAGREERVSTGGVGLTWPPCWEQKPHTSRTGAQFAAPGEMVQTWLKPQEMGTGGGSCPTTTAPRDTHGHTISCAQVSPAALCRKSSLRSPTLPRASRPLPSQPPSSAEALAINAMLHSPAPHPSLSLGRGTAPPASQEVLGAQEATWRILLPVQREKGKGGIDSLECFFCLSKPFMHRLSPLLAACFLLYLPS